MEPPRLLTVSLLMVLDSYLIGVNRSRINKKEMPVTGLVASIKVYWILEPARNAMKAADSKTLSTEFQQPQTWECLQQWCNSRKQRSRLHEDPQYTPDIGVWNRVRRDTMTSPKANNDGTGAVEVGSADTQS